MLADKHSTEERGGVKGFQQREHTYHGLRKISQDLITPPDEVKEEVDQHKVCPVNELFMAGAYWNVAPTHYYYVTDGVLCHFTIFTVTTFFLGNTTVDHTTQHRQAAQTTAIGEGTLCSLDNTAYDIVKAVTESHVVGEGFSLTGAIIVLVVGASHVDALQVAVH
ncbi:hypothetical protein GQ600_7376 [Phytophthora cactorum]|nr:hypothetical protein GQ600_7376 [Phytophthora cactorum]